MSAETALDDLDISMCRGQRLDGDQGGQEGTIGEVAPAGVGADFEFLGQGRGKIDLLEPDMAEVGSEAALVLVEVDRASCVMRGGLRIAQIKAEREDPAESQARGKSEGRVADGRAAVGQVLVGGAEEAGGGVVFAQEQRKPLEMAGDALGHPVRGNQRDLPEVGVAIPVVEELRECRIGLELDVEVRPDSGSHENPQRAAAREENDAVADSNEARQRAIERRTARDDRRVARDPPGRPAAQDPRGSTEIGERLEQLALFVLVVAEIRH